MNYYREEEPINSSRRGVNRRGKSSFSRNQNYPVDDKCVIKPIPTQPHENSSSSVSHLNHHERSITNSKWAPRDRFIEKEKRNSPQGSDPLSGVDFTSGPGGGGLQDYTFDDGSVCLKSNLDDCNVEISGFLDDADENSRKVEESKLNENEVVKRLLEISSRAEEPELLEFISINKQLQEDELLVLESIYGDNFSILHNQSGLKCFQVHIHVQVASEFLVTAKSNFHGEREDNAANSSYSFRVNYLPPVILTCLLPESYPSLCAPYFTITIPWLSSDKISELCGKLDSIWREQTGQEVLYQWVQWLHDSSLSYLGFDDEMVFDPSDFRGGDDARVISCGVSPDIDIALLKNYDEERCYEDFCKNLQECCICFSELPGSEFIRLPCQHFFCEKCLKTFSDMHLKEGTVLKIKCPETKCDGMIPPGLLKRLLGNEEFERLDELTLQRSLEAMNDVVYCPRCEMACLEDEENHAQCSKCYYSFCTFCLDRRHVGVSCMTPEMKLVVLQERQSSASMGDEQRRRERDKINQLLSIKEINRFAKQCPSCKMAISRTEGCNKMVCDNCGQYFCYRCNQTISGYEHFRDGSCELFPAEEIRRWEGRNGRQVVAEIQANMFPDHGHRCPICGQQNVKMGNNNHIFCWACQRHYCYLCMKTVRRCSDHYGPKGCKQHTTG